VRLLTAAALELARGEALQAEQARRPETSVSGYLERCRAKTGRLFGAACALGARLGGLGASDQERLERFGVALGLAFQLADDALDCDGDPAQTGKALGTDLIDGIATLPLILASARDPAVAAALRDGVAADAVLPTLARVAATGALRDTRALAVDWARRAERELDGTSGRCDARSLCAIVTRAVERDA
jgi:geranylgeranyl pyrophosphate synthase